MMAEKSVATHAFMWAKAYEIFIKNKKLCFVVKMLCMIAGKTMLWVEERNTHWSV